jgi:hypothetical protein
MGADQISGEAAAAVLGSPEPTLGSVQLDRAISGKSLFPGDVKGEREVPLIRGGETKLAVFIE